MEDILQCYKVLELEPGAPAERVRKAYLELAGVWDPDKHTGNPVLRSRAAKKRLEIEDAYKAIQHFLPELRADYDPNRHAQSQNRDFKEMERDTPTEFSKTLVGFIIAGGLLLVFALAFHIYKQTRTLPKSAAPVVDPETIPSSVVLDTSTTSSPPAPPAP